MNYEAEALAVTLKSERERRGLSQRDLSARSGVPQSHISKIETVGVDLRISSLAALANALGLEIALVPRKAVPAVQSISRSTGGGLQVLPAVAKNMAVIGKQLETVSSMNVDPETLRDVQRLFREIQQFQSLIRNPETLTAILRTVKTVMESDGMKVLVKVAKQMSQVRNEVAHGHIDIEPINVPRRAYQLDGDDDA